MILSLVTIFLHWLHQALHGMRINYLVCGISLLDVNSSQKQFFSQVKSFFSEDPYLYKTYGDGIIWRCILDKEIQSIFSYGGHACVDKTTAKILQASFF